MLPLSSFAARRVRFALAALCAPALLAAQSTMPPGWPSGRAKLRFELSISPSVRSEETTGRVYVILSRTEQPEPRLQIGRIGVPMFARDVERVAAGRPVTIDGSDLGHPVWDLADIPRGEYWVQAFVNVYSEFRRADGHVVWMHDDQWEGQHWSTSPNNLYSTARRLTIDPARAEVVRLTVDQKLPPIALAANTKWVERFRLQSPMLTKFWGRPIYIGATVLLPRDYATSTMSYPVLYEQGHFSTGNPLRFEEQGELGREWSKDDFPRMIVVTFQHPTPYFDDSYAVNSVNVGPYGDAIMQELIPEVEKRYRVIKEPWARWLHGGSTGGWEALALQIFNPDFFGGTWAYCPDPVTFSDVEGVNLYKDENAFYKQVNEWHRTPTINSRELNGEVRQTSQQRNWMEFVNGTKGRSGQQLDIWSAVFGPLGADGYFAPAWDKKTGVIDRKVVEYWTEHYDLMRILQKNWSTLGPKLVGKLHIYTGDMDSFFLDRAARELEAWMKTTSNPHYEGYFLWGDGKPHCWSGPVSQAQRLKEMAMHGMRTMPQGTTTPWWRY
jgi:putative esterase